MKTSSAKAKGRRLQQKIEHAISRILGIPCGKDCLIQSREMGQSGCDIKLLGGVEKLYPFSIECKNTEKWNLGKAIEQAKVNAEKQKLDWQIFLSKNNFDPVVVMDADVWFKLYLELHLRRQNRPVIQRKK